MMRRIHGILIVLLAIATIGAGALVAGSAVWAATAVPLQAPAQIRAEGKATLLEFYATWCTACRQLEPHVADLQNRLKNQLRIVRVDIDAPASQALVKAYRIESTPSYYFYDRTGALAFRMDQGWVMSGALRALAFKFAGEATLLSDAPLNRGIQLTAFHRPVCSPCEDARRTLKQAQRLLGTAGGARELMATDPQTVALMKRWGVERAPGYVVSDAQGYALLTIPHAMDAAESAYLLRFIRLLRDGRP